MSDVPYVTDFVGKEICTMPRGDHTGPVGYGPKTGRAAGYCAGYDMPGYVPHPAYLSEMQRFGVLPNEYQWKGPAEEMWRIDRAYWQSLWYRPTGK